MDMVQDKVKRRIRHRSRLIHLKKASKKSLLQKPTGYSLASMQPLDLSLALLQLPLQLLLPSCYLPNEIQALTHRVVDPRRDVAGSSEARPRRRGMGL